MENSINLNAIPVTSQILISAAGKEMHLKNPKPVDLWLPISFHLEKKCRLILKNKLKYQR